MSEIRFLFLAGFADSLLLFRGHLINELLLKGVQVHVAAPHLPKNSPLRERMESMGLKVHEVPLVRTGLNPFDDLKTIVALFRLMRMIRPDYMLAYTIKPVIYGALAAWLSGVKHRFVLITGLGYAFQDQRSRLQFLVRSMYTLALRKVDKVFFQNPDDQALFKNCGILAPRALSYVVNGSGVDVEKFSLAQMPQKNQLFLLIARFLGDKGIREYALAAEQVKSLFPDVRFALVGWIDENPDSILKSELDNWVSTGILENWGRLSDVRPAIAQCSVYVLPSYHEGTPRTVLEAMAMGRPIITTDAPGCRETVIHSENGFLVPVRDSKALAAAMLKFIADPQLVKVMGARSRKMAEEKYDVHKVNAFLLKEMGLYDKARI